METYRTGCYVGESKTHASATVPLKVPLLKGHSYCYYVRMGEKSEYPTAWVFEDFLMNNCIAVIPYNPADWI